MPRLSEKAKKIIEENLVMSSRELVEQIAIELGETYSNVTTNNHRNKCTERIANEIDSRFKSVTEELVSTGEPLYHKNMHFQEVREVTEGDLFNIIKDALKGEIVVGSELLARMKRGYPKMPFGGEKIGSGGWNSITYAIFEVLIASEQFYIKKE